MFSKQKLCILADIKRIQNEETGDNEYSIDNARKVIVLQDLVGIQTQQLAQSQNMIFAWTLEIDRMYYEKQKYLYIDDNLYEVKNIAKGSKPHLCKLSISANNDKSISQLIQEWRNANI